MKFELNVTHLLTGVTSRAFMKHKQSFAQVVPYLLEETFPNLRVVHLDKGRVVLESSEGERIRVVCSSDNKYDVYPSFTKGVGRYKEGVDIKPVLSELCSHIMFVDISNVHTLKVIYKDLLSLTFPDNGVFSFE